MIVDVAEHLATARDKVSRDDLAGAYTDANEAHNKGKRIFADHVHSAVSYPQKVVEVGVCYVPYGRDKRLYYVLVHRSITRGGCKTNPVVITQKNPPRLYLLACHIGPEPRGTATPRVRVPGAPHKSPPGLQPVWHPPGDLAGWCQPFSRSVTSLNGSVTAFPCVRTHASAGAERAGHGGPGAMRCDGPWRGPGRLRDASSLM